MLQSGGQNILMLTLAIMTHVTIKQKLLQGFRTLLYMSYHGESALKPF